jgi:thioredoxin-like negative regulator of GroEL
MRVTEIRSDTFPGEVLGVDEPVIVEFYSRGCPHCQVFNPIFDSISDRMGDQAKFVRLDVHSSEGNLRLAMGRGVRGVPTTEVFYRGRILGSLVGVHPLDQMEGTLEKFLSERDRHFEVHTPLARST